jgi:hypothetical protein
MTLVTSEPRTVLIPVLKRSTAVSPEELRRWWTQRRNELGKVDTVRIASIFFAGGEQRIARKEMPRLAQACRSQCLCR